MNGFPRVGTFAVGLIGLFTAFSYYGVPQLVPEAPPTEERVTGQMTTEEFIAAGARIYSRTCVLCHSGVGDRAPKLDTIGTVWRERISDPHYRGAAKTLGEYLRESMLEPSAYVVKGFGKPGTNDTESPMPDASKGAVALNPNEIDAVIAYLQSTAGVKVTVASRPNPAAGGKRREAKDLAAAKAPDEVSALRKFQCEVCHHLPGLPYEEPVQRPGPDLREIWKTAGRRVPGLDAKAFIAESILFPNKRIAEGFDRGLMPDDYGDRMLLAEFHMIVEYLAAER
jgi:cytochrome c5